MDERVLVVMSVYEHPLHGTVRMCQFDGRSCEVPTIIPPDASTSVEYEYERDGTRYRITTYQWLTGTPPDPLPVSESANDDTIQF